MSEMMTARIGGRLKPIGFSAGGKMFVFSVDQIDFLVTLEKLKDVTASALAVGRDEDWANHFLDGGKFRSYLSAKMQEFSAQRSLTVEWWWGFGKALAEGGRDRWLYTCAGCQTSGEFTEYEFEVSRQDNGECDGKCQGCYKPVKVTKAFEKFAPSREQVEGWKELGQRLIPKIERVRHQFENCAIEFESEGA